MTSTTTPVTWKPLVAGDSAAPVREIVDRIAADLAAWVASPPSPEHSLATGAGGLALFYAHLDRSRPDDEHERLAFDALDRVVEATAETDAGIGLYQGFPGVAWLAEHLQALYGETEGDDLDDLNAEVDQALLPLLATSPWPWDVELIDGLAGLGLYALERLDAATGGEILRRVVDRLDERSEKRPGGDLTWHTPPELIFAAHLGLFPDGQDNLGLSHGVPGVIALLAEIVLEPRALDSLGGRRAARVRQLLAGSTAWLLHQRLAPFGTSCFPSHVAPGQEPAPTRTAWCYGDPGVAAALWRAGRALGDDTLADEALATARLAFERPWDEMKIDDAGLCHGTAGMLQMAHRFWRASGDPCFHRVAERWLGETVHRHRPGEGIGGYRALVPDSERGDFWRDDPSFLTGTAGIGLALLATVSDVPPGWDRLLWLDLPPGRATPETEDAS